MQLRAVRVRNPRREHHGRQPRAMQDLVGIRVADAAQEMRVGERTLQCVITAAQRRDELPDGRPGELEAAGIVLGETRRAATT